MKTFAVPAVLRQFLPPPRGKLSWRDTAPLVIFLTLVLGGSWVATWMDWVMFTWPAAFVLLAMAPWLWWLHVAGYSGLRGWRALTSLFVRLGLLGLFVILFAEPRSVRKDDSLAVVFVLDQSQSVRSEAVEEAQTYIANLAAGKPQRDLIGLVTFGRSAVVESVPSLAVPEAFGQSTLHVERDGTSLESALSLGAAIVPEQHTGRLVLISDGVETQDNFTTVLDDLKSRGIAVDVLPIRYDYEHEVLVERLELPRSVKTGETYEAVAIVWSAQAGEGELVLQENGEQIARMPVTYRGGKNRFVIPIYLRDPGYYEYTVQVEAPPGKDSWNHNNRAISSLFLQGEGRVLVVIDPAGEARDHEFLTRALEQAQRKVEVITSYELPDDPMGLLPYDCVMFVNVGADKFVVTQFEALQEAVERYGAGFVMVGGENSFGPGGFHRSAVEDILPVTMDVTQRKVLPKSALAIVLHTCEFPQGNTWGKRITKQAIKVLGDRDEVGVLVYDYQGAEQWLFPLTPAAQYAMMAQKINSAQIGDMPDFAKTMQLALIGLQQSDAATKHMIIISDGDPQPPSAKLLQNYQQAQISISTVAVFPHGNQVTGMRLIAKSTGGNFYFPKNANLLPSIFIKEAKSLKRSMIQNRTFTPTVQFPSPILKGVEGLPPLHSYTITTAKPRSTTILEVPEVEEQEPILVTWRRGLGKSAAFTSDLSANWGKDWVDWDSYRAFVHQLVTDVSRVNKQANLRLSSFVSGGSGVVVVEDFAQDATFLNLTAEVDGPRELSAKLNLEQVGPRRYQAQFPLSGEGRYQIAVLGAGQDREERIFGGLMVPYSQEFVRLRANPLALEQIAEKTGGRVLSGDEKPEEVFVEQRVPMSRTLPVFDWFLIALACMVPVDVALRRVQLDWRVIRDWFGSSAAHKPSEETFSKLLRRKKSVEVGLDQHDESLVEARQMQTDVPQDDALAAPVAAPSEKTEAPAPEESTTARLVARRRQLRDEDES